VQSLPLELERQGQVYSLSGRGCSYLYIDICNLSVFRDQGLCSQAVLQVCLLHAGMGRYGQDLHNTACLALRQTNLLKKKSANRTTKTVRQLCNAKEHSCEAAQKAVEATKVAEKAVQNLAQFAGKVLSSSPARTCNTCMHLLPCCILSLGFARKHAGNSNVQCKQMSKITHAMATS